MKQNLIIPLRRLLGGYPRRAIITLLCIICCSHIAAYENVEQDGIGYRIYGDKAYVYGYWGNNDDVVIPKHLLFDYKKKSSVTFLPFAEYEIIHVDAEVVGIYHEAFRGCSSLKSINIPESVETIDAGAFRDCSSLKSISLPDSLKTISDSVFYNCTSLESVALPESLETIGKKAFYNCPSLTAMKISQTLKTIGDDAFAACTGLKNVEIYNTDALTIGYGAFKDCYSIEKVLCREIKKWCLITFSDSLANPIYYSHHLRYPPTTLYPKGKPVSKINVPKGIKEISPFAFIHADDMTYIDLPTSIEAIGDYAFSSAGANIQKVRVRFRDAFEIPDSTFNERTYRNTPLLVYIGNEEGFRNTKAWRNFKNISPTGDYVFTFEKIVNWDATLIELLESLGMENWDTNYDGVLSYGDDPLTLPDTTDEDMLLTWTSSNTDVAVINDYTLAIVGPGTITIVVSILDGDTNVLAAKEFTLTVAKCPSYIQFADATVKAICVANWDKDGDGELSEAEAAQVNNIGDIFQLNEEITSFNELQYFTGLTGISEAFRGCKGLTSVTIPNSVTSIGSHAFRNCSGLTSITIPNSVTSIGYYAFDGCSGLTSITIPNSVTSIGQYAFRNCSDLTSITIPNSVTSIGNYAFYGCSGLTSVTIPNSVTSIGNYAFYGCSGLTSITIPNSVTSIGNYAFYGCSGLTSVTIPNSVTSIGYSAFYGCRGLTSVTIPNSVTNIGQDAFRGCSGLTSIDIPNSVTSIGYYAFSYCSGLTSVTIPNSVTNIGERAFYNCSGLTKAEFASIESLCNISFGDYYANPLYYAKHLYINGQEVTDLAIPNSVTSIGMYAFYGCSGLTSVTIPNSVTTIGTRAFGGCSSLMSITLNSNDIVSKTYTSSSSKCLTEFFGNQVKEYILGDEVKSIGAYAFFYCSGLTSVTIPNSVTSIGDGAFYGCSGLTSVTIPNSVTSIGQYAFRNCSGLTSIDIPNSVTSIGMYAFYGCSGLTSVTIPNSVTSIGQYAFSYCSGLTSIDIPNSVTTIGGMAFDNTAWYNNQPDGLVYIGKVAYGYKGTMPSGTHITLKEGTLTITDDAFSSCSGLTSVTIPNSVTSIGSYAFYGCSGLTSVTIPNGVTSIGDWAFSYCSGLTSVTCQAKNVPSTGTAVFNNVPQNTATLYVPEESVNAYKSANQWKDFGTILPIVEPVSILGDANGNGEVEIGDVTSVLTLMATPEVKGYNKKAADANCNGEIEIGDVTTILTIMAKGE